MKTPERYGWIIGIAPEHITEYKRLHAAVWPGVLERLKAANVVNYSIFLKEPENLMFGYYEYVGEDHDADMAAVASDPETRSWWSVCGPLQRPLDTRKDGEWWAGMEEVFHME